MTDPRRSESAPAERWLTPVNFLNAPDGFPVPRSASSMLSPPDRLRVALHRDAKGVYEILGDHERRQESLWLVVEYVRVGQGHDFSLRADYRVAA